MTPIERRGLPEPVQARLDVLSEQIVARPPAGRTAEGRKLWTTNTSVKRTLRARLQTMSLGRNRCMYCGDNEGTDIDHYEPLAREPLRTFDWLNHLLACGVCNSHKKRDAFPMGTDGKPLLLDPTVDDPFDHLVLSLATGEYHGRTDRGAATIDICDLNRPLLTRGRMQARRVVVLALRQWHLAVNADDPAGRNEAALTVREQPLADVYHAMLSQARTPLAHVIFADVLDVLDVLRSSALLADLAGERSSERTDRS